MHAHPPLLLQNVSVDNQLCGAIGVATSVNTISCGNKIGNSIKVQLTGFGMLTLCEVQVWGFTPTAITDANIGTAATAWATSPTTAATTYGNIADRDVATVNPTATTLEGVMRRPLELTVGLVAVSLALIAAVTCHERKLRRITHGGVALGCLVLLLFPAGGSGQTSSLVLSTNKPAAQSSVDHIGSASKAVDGDTNSQFSAGSCTHTNGNGESSPWWTVDLGASYAIEKVRFRSEPRA